MWKKTLNHCIRKLPDGGNRIVCIEVKSSDDLLCVVNCYLPSRGCGIEADYVEALDEVSEILYKYGSTHRIIFMGDLNASLNHELPTYRDNHLISFCREHEINTDVRSEPTFFHVNGVSCSQIDYILLRDCDHWLLTSYDVISYSDLVTNTSDHIPVVASLKLNHTRKSGHRNLPSTYPARVKWEKVNKDDYSNAVYDNIIPSCDITSDEVLHFSVHELIRSLKEASHLYSNGSRKSKASKNGLKIWTPEISKAISVSKKAHWEWKQAGSPSDPHDQSSINRKSAKANLRSTIRSHTRNQRVEQYNKTAAAKSDDSKLFFKLISQQRGKNHDVTDELIVDDKVLGTPQQISEAFSEHFHNLANPDRSTEFSQSYKDDAVFNRMLIDDICSASEDNIEYITHDEMYGIIDSLSNGKAADVHELTAEHLKYGGPVVIEYLVNIVNYIFKTGNIPDIIKMGILTPVLKKGKDPTKTANYRGITVTSIIMKVVEKAWLLRVVPTLKEQQNPMQHGFTQSSSSINAALLVSEALNEAYDIKKPVHITLLDASKAFDVVDHDILLNELYDIGVKGKLWLTFQSMYQNTTSSVKWKGILSSDFSVKQGVRQGGVTSAPGYKIYTNNLLNQLQSQKIGCAIGTTLIPAPTCADDIAIITNDPVEGQILLNQVDHYSNTHRYTINPSKSATIKYQAKDNWSYNINGEPIPTTHNATHLGVERNSSNKPNIDDMMKMGRRVSYAMMGAGLHGKDGMPPGIAYHLIMIYVIPRMLYGAEVHGFSLSDLAQLERFYRKLLRQIQFLPSKPPPANTAIYALIGAKPIEAHIDTARLTLLGNIARQPDSIEHQIAQRQLAMKDNRSKSWFIKVKELLMKYGLPSPYELLSSPPTKDAWKNLTTTAIDTYWQTKWQDDHAEKSSLKRLNIDACKIGTPHHIWSTLPPDCREVEKAAIKARLITGTYVLQYNQAKYNQYENDPTCILCKTATEDITHFLVKCPALAAQRGYHHASLQRTLLQNCDEPEVTKLFADDELLVQFIMDCSHEKIQRFLTLPLRWEYIFEPITRQWCYNLHVKRCNLLKQLMTQ